MQSVPAIAFDYAPSRRVAIALAAAWALALAALLTSAASLALDVALGTLASLYAGIRLRRYWRQPVQRLAWYEAGFWQVRDRAGVEFQASLRGSAVIGEWVFLRLQTAGAGNLSLILWSDNSASDVRRKLRVRLSRSASKAESAR